MRQAQAITVLAVLLAAGTMGLLPGRVNAETSKPLVQVAPGSVTGQLDENSQTLDDGSYFNIHTFEGTAGATIRIEMLSEEFDTYFILLGPEGKRIGEADDSNGSTNARLVVTLPATGTYQILANSFSPLITGQYKLSWSSISDANASDANATLPAESNSPEWSLAELLARELDNSLPVPLMQWFLQEFAPLNESNTVYQSASVQRASTLNREAMALYQAGRYSEAESYLNEVLAILREEFGERHPAIANSLSGLALVYRAQNRQDESESLYQEVLAIDREHLGESHPDVAQTLRNLAGVYVWQGRYGEAESLYEEALNIRRTAFGNRHHQVAVSLHDLAGVYRLLGRYDETERCLQEALSIYRDRTDEPSIANGLNDLAGAYADLNRYDEAEALLKEVLELRRKAPGNQDLNISDHTNNLAVLYTLQGRYTEAQKLFEEALSIRREQLGDHHPAVAQSLNNLATNTRALGRYDEAVNLARQGLDIRRERLGNRSPVVAQSLDTLSTAYLAQGNISQAINTLHEGLNIEELNLDLNLATLNDAQRRAYAVTLSNTTQKALSLHLQAAPNDPQAAQLALTTLLRRKGRILDAGTDSLRVLRQNSTPEDQATLDQLIEVYRDLSALTFNPPPNLPPEQYQSRLTQLEAEANQLEAELARRSATFRANTQPVDLAVIQAKIPANGVLVEYVRYQPFDAVANSFGKPRYAVYLLFPDAPAQSVDLGDAAEIDAAVESFRRLLQDPSADLRAGASPAIQPDLIERVTGHIKTLVFDPIAPYLTGREHLLISPDSQLNRLPFEALQAETGGKIITSATSTPGAI
jgi:tetratricopeptide (TPR) repeat protein